MQDVHFDAGNLAEQIERLSHHALDYLPFGVIQLDREGTVIFYCKTEAEQSGYGKFPIGENLFETCMASNDFRGRIESAIAEGPIDLEFDWAGDFAGPSRNLRLRVISSNDHKIWIFIDRDGPGEAPRKLS
jgi:photoactive yellow protein